MFSAVSHSSLVWLCNCCIAGLCLVYTVLVGHGRKWVQSACVVVVQLACLYVVQFCDTLTLLWGLSGCTVTVWS